MIYDLFELSKLNIKVHGNLTVLDMVKDLLIYARNQNKDLDAKE